MIPCPMPFMTPCGRCGQPYPPYGFGCKAPFPFQCGCACNSPTQQNEKFNGFVILQGDGTGAVGNQPIIIKFDTDLNLDGCTVLFSFLGFVQSFVSPQKGEDDKITLQIDISSAVSKSLPLGMQYASLSISKNQETRTLMNKIPVLVTDNVGIAYGVKNEMQIEIDTGAAIRTVLNGISWNAGGTIGSLRDFLAKIGEVLGADITEREVEP